MKVRWIDSKSRQTKEVVLDVEALLKRAGRDTQVIPKPAPQHETSAVAKLNTRATDRPQAQN